MAKQDLKSSCNWHDLAQVFAHLADILFVNGPAHMVFAASMTLVTAPYVHEYLLSDIPLTPGMLVAEATVAVGVTLMPDLDTIKSRASSALGPFTRAISRVVSALSGGHRYGTHTIWAVIAVALLSWQFLAMWGSSLPVMLATTTFFVSFAVRELVGERLPSLFVLLVSVILAFACLSVSATYEWFWGAIVNGYAMHLVADSLTTEGVRLLWPLSSRSFGLKAFDSDSFQALVVTQLAGAFMLFLLLVQLVLPAFAANHPDLMMQSQLLQDLVSWAPSS